MTNSEEITHLKELRVIVVERRRWLEKQLANYGVSEAPVNILLNLDTTKKEIEQLDEHLLKLGENIILANNSDLTDQISYLEQELTKIRKHLAIQSSLRTGFPWREHWYDLQEDSVTIYGKNGNHKNYNFRQIANIANDNIDVFVDHVLSIDGMLLAITISNGFVSFMSRAYPDEYKHRLDRQVLCLFKFGMVEPLFSTSDNKYVHCPPSFSEDGQLLVFSYSHNWRPQVWVPEPSETDPPTLESSESIGIVEWDETISVIETNTGRVQDLFTEASSGYARWAEPHHFFDLSFVQLGSVIFGISIGGRGVLQTWNIPIDGSEPIITPNPFFE